MQDVIKTPNDSILVFFMWICFPGFHGVVSLQGRQQ